MRPSRRPVCAALVALSTVGALSAAGAASGAPAAPDRPGTVTRIVPPADDAFVDSTAPRRTSATAPRLVVSTSASAHRAAYLRFWLPDAPAGTTLTGARLVVRTDGTVPVQLRRVTDTAWGEETLAYATRPAAGRTLATATPAAGGIGFDVKGMVTPGAPSSFALTVAAGSTGVWSRDSEETAPRLYLTYAPTATPTPTAPVPTTTAPVPTTPPTTPPATPAPTTPPTTPPTEQPTTPPTTAPVPTETTPAEEPVVSDRARTRFGMSLPYAAGLTAAEVVAKNRETYGSVPVARIYSTSIPAKWTSDRMLAALGDDSDVIFSFQGDLDAIAAGAYDERMRTFLAGKPAGVKAWIVLHHEPEDDVARGHFTAAQFKAATAHIAPVIRSAGGIPTTVLMAWTLKEASGRDYRDYYSPAIDVLAFDAYNTAQKKEIPSYKAPEKFLASVLAVKAETGKDFGFAEFGSPCIVTDPTCTQRAAWLTAVGTAMQDAGAEFMAYWNRPALKDAAVDFTLNDAASLTAWRQLIAGS